MTRKQYDIARTYRVVRMPFIGYSISIPIRTECGGIACRKLHYEMIEYGGKILRCAKDHQERVIYIDTHTMEDALESSG
jgi:hypothetical protein